MTDATPNPIRVLAFREDDAWVAQCLEYDISAYADDFETAMRRLEVTVNAECHYTMQKYGSEFASIDPAPAEFEKRFAELSESLQRDNLELRIAA